MRIKYKQIKKVSELVPGDVFKNCLPGNECLFIQDSVEDIVSRYTFNNYDSINFLVYNINNTPVFNESKKSIRWTSDTLCYVYFNKTIQQDITYEDMSDEELLDLAYSNTYKDIFNEILMYVKSNKIKKIIENLRDDQSNIE